MEEINTLHDFLRFAEKSFKKAKLFYGHGTNNPWDEACAIAFHVLNLPIDANAEVASRPLKEAEKKNLLAFVKRRVEERIPIPYLTHEAWFAGLKFYVDERVIIPRSPFGELIENGFSPWLQHPVQKILDLCTGSGCMAIAAAHYLQAGVDAIDISPEALAVAKINVDLHHCADKVRLLASDLFGACQGQRYDIIISNPPYVSAKRMKRLPKEYHYEPELALMGGEKGLDIVERIIRQAPDYLNPQGLLFVEVGEGAEALEAEFPHLPFTWVSLERGSDGIFVLQAEDLNRRF